ncbi:CAP domain-containing protein [Thamnidium elegans]|nr:CAP domain-containing protein [Thamnidium elegans]
MCPFILLLLPFLISVYGFEKRNIVSSYDVETILATHNKYRALHGSPALNWSKKLAAYANQWSGKCIFNSGSIHYGENTAGRSSSWPQTIEAWYNEEKKYNYKNPGFNSTTGHFTQLVWKNTKQVGCAFSYCNSIKGNFYVCEYEPRGNIIFSSGDISAYYRTNVTATLK